MDHTNPDYGNGIFRRRIRLQSKGNVVIAELEDVCHGFLLFLYHDQDTVIDIQAEMLRFPFNTCPESTSHLQPFVGSSLASGNSALRQRVEPAINCTHLYDLALLAIAHGIRNQREPLVYDVEVPDIINEKTTLKVFRNGELMHEWALDAYRIISPASLSGKPIMKGFYDWVSSCYQGSELEAAIVLHKGFYVSRARLYAGSMMASKSAKDDGMPHSACYTYGKDAVGRAFRIAGTMRDFTETPEDLLRFK